MAAFHVIGAVVSAVLFTYLLFAMLAPEKLS